MTNHYRHDVVALAASASQKSQTQASRDAARIGNAAKRASLSASQWSNTAMGMASKYVLKVGQNNAPGRVAQREDVKAAAAHAAGLMSKKISPLLDSAWKSGQILGEAAARRQAVVHGLPRPKHTDLPEDMLLRLRADLRRIESDAPKLLLEQYAARGEEGLLAAQRRIAFRMSLVIDAALKYAAQAALEAGLRNGDTRKQWHTRSPVPCSHCKNLNGMVRDWGEPFPTNFPGLPKLPVHDSLGLQRPPRHPLCRCIIVVVPKSSQ